jgi:hypothetical protein
MKVAQTAESLTRELQQLRGDFDALDVELRESVRQLVADSFSTVESTVLSALDAVQEEILYGASEPSAPSGKTVQPRQKPERRPTTGLSGSTGGHGGDKIIPMGPLFADLNRVDEQPEAEPPEAEAEKGDADKKAKKKAKKKGKAAKDGEGEK